MTKESANFGLSIEPQAEAPQSATPDVQEPSSGIGSSMAPTSAPCRRCGNAEPPLENGQCPNTKCRSLRAGHTRNRKTPDIDRSRLQQLVEKIKSDFKPATQSLVTTCEQLATVTERLEKVKPGSVEHQRLFQMWQTLTDRLESTRPEARASSATVVILPANHREWDERVEQGEDLLRELRGQRTPDAADAAREPQASAEPAAPSAADALLDRHLVPERTYRETTNAHGYVVERRGELRMRRVTEREIEQCLDACGDLQNYRDGRISREQAVRWTAAWVKAQWNESEL